MTGYLAGLFSLLYLNCPYSAAQEAYYKTCISESSPSIAAFVEEAKARLAHDEPFAEEYCLSEFRMTSREVRLTFARNVEFDPGTGDDDIQHGFVEFYITFDPQTKMILEAREVLRP